MIFPIQFLVSLLLLLAAIPTPEQLQDNVYISETLQVQRVSKHVYQHVSYLQTESFGKVACNGMVVFDKGEAVVFDTPADAAASEELIKFVEEELHGNVKAVVATHFHTDCLGGLEIFRQHGIVSYASNRTIEEARSRNLPTPEKSFEKQLRLRAGRQQVRVAYLGEGHTSDNVVGYVPADKVLFGGCLVKEAGAGKGNLEDANVAAWPQTVAAVKAQYPSLEIVIPGHGKPGGPELLDYTMQLFQQQ